MKSRLKRSSFVSFLNSLPCLLVFCILAVVSSYGQPPETITRSFEVSPGGRLTVRTDLGSIDVSSGSNNRVQVEVVREVRGNGSREEILNNFRLDFEQQGGNVTVTGKILDRHWFGRRTTPLNVRYRIRVPQTYNVDLKTTGGSVTVDDLNGEVRSQTSGGSLSFGRIQGSIWGRTSGGGVRVTEGRGAVDLKTSGGPIEIGTVQGEVNAETSGGSIDIQEVRGPVQAKTSGGSISVREVFGPIQAHTSGGNVSARISRQPEADCQLSTSGGSVTVYLPEGVNLSVEASTSAGRVVTDFPVTVQGTLTQNSLRADLGSGGP